MRWHSMLTPEQADDANGHKPQMMWNEGEIDYLRW
jgi:hypothetical protein